MTTASWPGLSRPSTSWRPLRKKDVDVRHPSTPRLRRAFSVLGRRSFSEGGKAGHDEFHWSLFESAKTGLYLPEVIQHDKQIGLRWGRAVQVRVDDTATGLDGRMVSEIVRCLQNDPGCVRGYVGVRFIGRCAEAL